MEIESLDSYTFPELAKMRNYIVTQAGKDLVQKGIDFHLKGVYRNPTREVNLLFAVKRKKIRSKSKYADRWTWIEYKKSPKQDGWIYGPAHFIAFERSEDFIIVNHKVLLGFLISNKCRVRWDLPFVSSPKEAKYKIYANPRSGAKITQILSKDILKLEGVQVWKKEVHGGAEIS